MKHNSILLFLLKLSKIQKMNEQQWLKVREDPTRQNVEIFQTVHYYFGLVSLHFTSNLETLTRNFFKELKQIRDLERMVLVNVSFLNSIIDLISKEILEILELLYGISVDPTISENKKKLLFSKCNKLNLCWKLRCKMCKSLFLMTFTRQRIWLVPENKFVPIRK